MAKHTANTLNIHLFDDGVTVDVKVGRVSVSSGDDIDWNFKRIKLKKTVTVQLTDKTGSPADLLLDSNGNPISQFSVPGGEIFTTPVSSVFSPSRGPVSYTTTVALKGARIKRRPPIAGDPQILVEA